MFTFYLKKDIKYKLYLESKSFSFSENNSCVISTLVSWKAWIKTILWRINLKWKTKKLHLPVNREILNVTSREKINDDKESDITEVWAWLCTDRLRRDGWVCMERSDWRRGERFTGLKKPWTKMTKDLSAWTDSACGWNSPAGHRAYKWPCRATEGKKVHYKIKQSLVIIFPKIHWIK